jgi:hypothetical protein
LTIPRLSLGRCSNMNIHNEISKAEKSKDFKKCIELYRKAIKSPDLFQANQLFDIKFNLANLLINDSNNIEEAINIFSNLLQETDRMKETEKFAYLNLGLGFAYDQRTEGNRNENLKKVVDCYEEALVYFRKDTQPEKWASTKAGIGLAYAEIKNGENTEYIIKAIESYLDTLLIYTKNEYPEDYEDSIKELAHLKKRLNDENLWDKMMDRLEAE